MRPVLVTGGTGTLGRAVVAELAVRGAAVRVLSRRPRAEGPLAGVVQEDLEWVIGDLFTGAGLDKAVCGVRAIVHCATDVRRPSHDVKGTRRLVAAALAAGTPHLVYVSIVGVDRVPLSYYRLKLEVESIVQQSGLPWTVLRATQFHDLIAAMLRVLVRLPVLLLPAGTAFQPVDVRDVASCLIGLTDAPPARTVLEFGGPQVLPATDLARAYLRQTGRRRPLLSTPLPGATARGYRQGAHLAPPLTVGHTFEQWLTEQDGAPRASRGGAAPRPRGEGRRSGGSHGNG